MHRFFADGKRAVFCIPKTTRLAPGSKELTALRMRNSFYCKEDDPATVA